MIQNIDNIQINFNSDNLWLVNLTLSLVMFGVALDIKMSDFRSLIKSPKAVITGIILQFVMIPLATFLLVNILNPHPSVALGMIMVAACPGGSVSNFMTKLAGGNAALSVSLTAFASLAALIMTPLNVAVWGNLYEPTSSILKTVNLSPMEVANFVVLILGIPLVLGMIINNYHPNFSKRLSKILKPLSIIIFLAFIIVAFINNFAIFIKHIHFVFFLVLLHNSVLLILGFYTAKFIKLSYLDQKTLSIETGIQNSGLGLLLVFSFFDGLGGMALLVAFWAIWDIVSGLLIAYYWSKKRSKKVAV